MDDLSLKQRALDLCGKGYRHHMQGDLTQAIELYTQSIDLCPTAEAYTFRGWSKRSVRSVLLDELSI
jgi:hypothetical protein